MAYAALDYYALDDLFTHEERVVRDTVRELVSSRVMPGIGKHFSAGTFPHELVPVFGEMGLLGPSLTGYGCAGVMPSAYGLICQELKRGDSGVQLLDRQAIDILLHEKHQGIAGRFREQLVQVHGVIVDPPGQTVNKARVEPVGSVTKASSYAS